MVWRFFLKKTHVNPSISVKKCGISKRKRSKIKKWIYICICRYRKLRYEYIYIYICRYIPSASPVARLQLYHVLPFIKVDFFSFSTIPCVSDYQHWFIFVFFWQIDPEHLTSRLHAYNYIMWYRWSTLIFLFFVFPGRYIPNASPRSCTATTIMCVRL